MLHLSRVGKPGAGPVTRPWLVYGAYGFTGRLVVDEARRRGLEPVLGGRDARRLEEMARETGLEHRIFALDDLAELSGALEGVELLLSCAGPFSATFAPMVEACLEAGAHYLDVTGEIDVFEAARALDGRAREAGVVVMPGVGFDVVPTDCAAARAAGRVEDPAWLDLAFVSGGATSRGSARTVLEALGRPGRSGRVRKDGRIEAVRLGSVRRRIPFGDGARDCVAIPWGDVSTAYHTTGVPDVRVFIPDPTPRGPWLQAADALFSLRPVAGVGRWLLDGLAEYPDRDRLSSSGARVWCEAGNDGGNTATVEMVTPNAYLLTADAAVSAVEAVLGGDLEEPGAGALTPAGAFGAGFVDRLRGVRWILP